MEIPKEFYDSAQLKIYLELILSYAPKVLGALVTLFIGFWLANILSRKLKKFMMKRNMDETLIPFLSTVLAITLKILVLLSAASMFGFEVTSFIALFSAMVLGIGLALQGNLSHMASGIMILIFRPFRVGDVVSSNGHRGTVKEINLFATILTTFDQVQVVIPNGLVMGNPLENFTTNDMRKVFLTFSVSYDTDIDRAKVVIKQVVETCELVDNTQETEILVNTLGNNSVDFSVRPWAKAQDYWKVYFYMQEQIKKAFDKAGITIPFPQMDVHFNKA